MKEYRGCKYSTVAEVKAGDYIKMSEYVQMKNLMIAATFPNSDTSVPLKTKVLIEDIVKDKYTEEELEKINKETIDSFVDYWQDKEPPVDLKEDK